MSKMAYEKCMTKVKVSSAFSTSSINKMNYYLQYLQICSVGITIQSDRYYSVREKKRFIKHHDFQNHLSKCKENLIAQALLLQCNLSKRGFIYLLFLFKVVEVNCLQYRCLFICSNFANKKHLAKGALRFPPITTIKERPRLNKVLLLEDYIALQSAIRSFRWGNNKLQSHGS